MVAASGKSLVLQEGAGASIEKGFSMCQALEFGTENTQGSGFDQVQVCLAKRLWRPLAPLLLHVDGGMQ